jgi:hypothetical protein
VSNLVRRSFLVMVNPLNQSPTISPISDQTINEDGEIMLEFTIDDAETPATGLAVAVFSSNEELIDSTGLIRGGLSANRTVTLRPLTNQFGSATITLTVTDDKNSSSSTTFEFRVQPQNDAPVVSSPSEMNVAPDVSTPVAFTVNDQDTPPGDLHVVASSSNPGLVPPANLQVTGNGSSRMVTIRPIANQTGTAVITLTVNDGSLTNAASFNLNVTPDASKPPLQIELAGTNVIVSWSTNIGSDWLLQTNATAASNSWNVAGLAPALEGGRYRVTLPAVGEAKFFRLCHDCSGSGPPALRIARTATGVIVSWPAAPDTFVLESRNALDASSAWTTASDTPEFADGSSSLTVNANGTGKFFRLRTR